MEELAPDPTLLQDEIDWILSGKPKTFEELERYFYTKLLVDPKLKDYFYNNLTTDPQLKRYFQVTDSTGIEENEVQSLVKPKKFQSYFYLTLQKDKYFRDYFYRSETERSSLLEERFKESGTSFYSKHTLNFPDATGPMRKPTPKPVPKPAPAPKQIPRIVAPPVSTPTYSAANPLPPAPKPVAPKPLPAVKPVPKPAPVSKKSSIPNTIKSINSGNLSAIPKLIKESKNPQNIPSRQMISSLSTGKSGQTINTYVVDMSTIGVGSVMTSSYYKNGRPDLKANNKEVMRKTFEQGKHHLGEETGYYEVKRLVTGKDPVDGSKASRLAAAFWLVAGRVPLLKNLDNISDASKGLKTFDRVTGTVKVSKSAVDTAKVAKSATVGTWVVNNGDALLDTSRTIKPAKEYVKQADGSWKAVNKVDEVVPDVSSSVTGTIGNNTTKSVSSGHGNGVARQFVTGEKLIEHFEKHSSRFKGVYSNPEEYLNGANDVIKNGIKVEYAYRGKDTIGYVKFMGNNSRNGISKFEFVGTNSEGFITTYHIKEADDLFKILNGSGQIKNIVPAD